MEKMIGYIFGNIEIHDKAIGVLVKDIRKQIKFNKSMTLFAVVTTACLYTMDAQRKKMEKDIEELKKTKGE